MGDCYFLASLAGIAQMETYAKQSKAISVAGYTTALEKMFASNSDGSNSAPTWGVRYYDAKGQAQWVTVNTEKIVFLVSLKKARIDVEKRNEEIAVKGQLGNLQVIEKSHTEEIELLGLLEEKNSSLCEFKLKSMSEANYSLEISFDPIKIDLMMPSFSVIIAYLSSNLINLLQSKNVGANTMFSTPKRKSQFTLKV